MNNSTKLTTAQVYVIHSLEVLMMGAIFTAVVTVYSAFQAGNFDLTSLGVSLSGVLIAFLSNGIKGIILNANTAQAASDTIDELKQSHNALLAQVANLAGLITSLLHLQNAPQQVAQPPVVVHVNNPPASTPAAAPVTPVQPVQPVVQPVQQPEPVQQSVTTNNATFIPPSAASVPQFAPMSARHFGDSGIIPAVPPVPPS